MSYGCIDYCFGMRELLNFLLQMLMLQAFTNCKHVYDRAHNKHASSITCTQKFVYLYWFFYVKIIWICQCILLFSALCLVAYSSYSSCCHASYLAALCWFFLFVCFYRNQFCSPAINQMSLSQSKSWFLLHSWVLLHFLLFQHSSSKSLQPYYWNFLD